MRVDELAVCPEKENELRRLLEIERQKREELEEKLNEQKTETGTAADDRSEDYRKRFYRMFWHTTGVLVVVAAVAVLIATLLTPAFRIYGSSMTPTLQEGEIVLSVRTANFRRGDLVAFYFNNKILVKRVIAFPGEWVDIDTDGNVTVDGKQMDEPYLDEKALGACDIKLPYQVPDDRYFVLGDHRSTSIDSRNSAIGCISKEMVAGRLLFKVWPLNRFRKF